MDRFPEINEKDSELFISGSVAVSCPIMNPPGMFSMKDVLESEIFCGGALATESGSRGLDP